MEKEEERNVALGLGIRQPAYHFKPYTIEGFVGPMFSGKTESLLRRIDPLRWDPNHYEFIGIKPLTDDRKEHSRSIKNFIDWEFVKSSNEIVTLARDYHLIALDETQFFDKGIVKVVLELQKMGKNIVFAGLDRDFRGEPFGSMKELMFYANELKKLNGICRMCGQPGYYTQRLIKGNPANYNSPIISIENEKNKKNEKYTVRCFKDHKVPGKPEKILIN